MTSKTKKRENRKKQSVSNTTLPPTRIYANPSDVGVVSRSMNPRISSVGMNGLTVRHSEYNNILSSAASNGFIYGYGFNPCDTAVFPWLANIGNCYSMYRWKKLEVNFASIAPTTQSGTTAMGLFYDFGDLANWYNGSSLYTSAFGNLMACSEITIGPSYGSHFQGSSNSVSGRTPMSLKANVARTLQRTPWYLINQYDPSASEANDNQAVAVYLGAITGANGVGNSPNGYVMVSYEIEFMNPVSPNVNADIIPSSRSGPAKSTYPGFLGKPIQMSPTDPNPLSGG